MSKEPTDKSQILLKGGEYKELNYTVENWLNFLTNPVNLQPGLPELTVDFLKCHGGCTIHVTFAETKPSIVTLKLSMGNYGILLPVFEETDPEQKAAKLADPAYAATNPHCLRDWIFGLFEQSELESLRATFLNSELPDLFDQLPNLRTVNLHQSEIKRLPPSFYRLPALVSLDISGSKISEVPPELGQVQTLRRLTLSQPSSPSILGSLRGLTDLNYKGSNVNIPSEITQLTELKQLSLSRVASAPDNFLNFPKLENLYFNVTEGHSSFSFTRANVPNLKKLETNYPAAFVPSITSCKSLEDFNMQAGYFKPPLTKSELDTLSKSLKQIHALKRIDLQGLGITDIEFCISHPNLEYVYLGRNKIVDVPPGLGDLLNLKTLDLSENAIVHVPVNLVSLYGTGALRIQKNPFTRIPDSDIKNETRKRVIRYGGTYEITLESGEWFTDWLQFLTNPLNLQPGLPDLTIILDGRSMNDAAIKVSFDKNKASLRSLKMELDGYLGDPDDLYKEPGPTEKETFRLVDGKPLRPPHFRKWVFNLFLHTELQELQVPFPNNELPDLFAGLKKK